MKKILFGNSSVFFSLLWKAILVISGISSASVAKLGKGANITTDVLLRICEAPECDITDIIELVNNTLTNNDSKE